MTDGIKAAITANKLIIGLEEEMTNRQRQTSAQKAASQLNWVLYQMAGMENKCHMIRNELERNPRLTGENQAKALIELETARACLCRSAQTIKEANVAASNSRNQTK